MQTPLQITFRHMATSPAVEARVRELAARLEHFNNRIIGCHVVIEAPAAHRNKGAPFLVRIELILPGRDVHVNSERAERAAHADVHVALRDAFDAAKRLLEEQVREQRLDVKHHELPQLGTVTEIGDESGRIDGDDGRFLYFHRNSVHGCNFSELRVGNVVEYEAEPGDQGPQAVAVRLWRKPAHQPPANS